MQHEDFPTELLRAAQGSQVAYYQTQRAQNGTVKSLETALPANWILLDPKCSQPKQTTNKVRVKPDGASGGCRRLHRRLNSLARTSIEGEKVGIFVETQTKVKWEVFLTESGSRFSPDK